jgi:hypothetical protein
MLVPRTQDPVLPPPAEAQSAARPTTAYHYSYPVG